MSLFTQVPPRLQEPFPAMGNHSNASVSSFPEFLLAEEVWRVGSPILLAVGTVGNVLSILVLTRKKLRKITTMFYLAVLALADLAVLYTGLLRLWMDNVLGVYLRLQSDFACKLHTFLVYFTLDFSVWILVAVTVDRCLCVSAPFTAKRWCTLKQARLVVVVIAAALFLINMHYFWTVSVIYHGSKSIAGDESYTCHTSEDPQKAFFVEKVWPWLDFCVVCFIPFIIMVVCNSLIVRQIISSTRRLRAHSEMEVEVRSDRAAKRAEDTSTKGWRDEREAQDDRAGSGRDEAVLKLETGHRQTHGGAVSDGVVQHRQTHSDAVSNGVVRHGKAQSDAISGGVVQHRKPQSDAVSGGMVQHGQTHGDAVSNGVVQHRKAQSDAVSDGVVQHWQSRGDAFSGGLVQYRKAQSDAISGGVLQHEKAQSDAVFHGLVQHGKAQNDAASDGAASEESDSVFTSNSPPLGTVQTTHPDPHIHTVPRTPRPMRIAPEVTETGPSSSSLTETELGGQRSLTQLSPVEHQPFQQHARIFPSARKEYRSWNNSEEQPAIIKTATGNSHRTEVLPIVSMLCEVNGISNQERSVSEQALVLKRLQEEDSEAKQEGKVGLHLKQVRLGHQDMCNSHAPHIQKHHLDETGCPPDVEWQRPRSEIQTDRQNPESPKGHHLNGQYQREAPQSQTQNHQQQNQHPRRDAPGQQQIHERDGQTQHHQQQNQHTRRDSPSHQQIHQHQQTAQQSPEQLSSDDLNRRQHQPLQSRTLTHQDEEHKQQDHPGQHRQLRHRSTDRLSSVTSSRHPGNLPSPSRPRPPPPPPRRQVSRRPRYVCESLNRHCGIPSVTVMLLTVNSLFWLLTAPIVVFVIGYAYWAPEASAEDTAELSLGWALVNMLQYANNAVHFFLYCLTGPRFRQELAALCSRSPASRGRVHSSGR